MIFLSRFSPPCTDKSFFHLMLRLTCVCVEHFGIKRVDFLHLLVHVLQARKDHDAVGQATLQQEMEGIPVERWAQLGTSCLNFEIFFFFY